MTLQALNALPLEQAVQTLLRCCGCQRWADAVANRRPFSSAQALFEAADAEWDKRTPADVLEAMGHHPRIGDVDKLREKFKATAGWSGQEQSGVSKADEATLQALAAGNARYEAKFGFIFLVCATGKSAAQMLGLLEARLNNDPGDELEIAAQEQAKITRIRLEKLLS